MRVAVVGAGAIGCTLGAALAPRHEVELVARGEHLRALRERGLVLDGKALKIPAVDVPLPRADLAILAVKTQDVEAAAPSAKDAARVLCIQNGLAAEGLAAKHVKGDVLGAVTAIDAEFLEPGVVTVGRVGGLVIGGRGAEEIARVFAESGIPARATANLAGARWMKLLVNLNNAILAATGTTTQDAFRDARLARLGVRAMREGLAVAKAEGVRLEAIPWASPTLAAGLAGVPEALATRLLMMRARRLAGDVPLRGSTQQSLLRGKPTEVRWLNGEVTRRGRARGIPTPTNDALVAAVERVETSGEFLVPAQLLAMAQAA